MKKIKDCITNVSRQNLRTWTALAGILLFAFFAGRTLGIVDAEAEAVVASGGTGWGLRFPEEGKAPTANASASYLKKYNAYYIEETEEKVIYLTFDCGFENGNTGKILDALKKHQAPATFFIVGNYLETSPDLVRRMVDEGHLVGNHTWHHPDMSKIVEREAFEKELGELANKYEEEIGKPMTAYYRPPQGIYSENNLKLAKELGYSTIFWSLAYVDWNQNSQPTREQAFDKLLGRIHPGAIVLLHNTSDTNGQIMDELLTKWEEMGYRFGSLDDLTKN
jgi:peptidoglycan-N-acetylmuramic acid deacetylase